MDRRLTILSLLLLNLTLVTCHFVTKGARTPSAKKTTPLPTPPKTDLSLRQQCDLRVQQLKKSLDSTFSYVVHPPFVVAGDLPQAKLDESARWHILKPAQALWASYFKKQPDKAITVLLFNGQQSYRLWARRLFNDTKPPYFGYYTNHNRTLIMDISTGTGTLIHELTHALIVYDFPDVPDWFNEGLASLHEGCRVGTNEIIGMLNWRLPILKKAIKEKRLRTIPELLADQDFYGKHVDENYAQARYLMMYAQKLGLLRTLYAEMRARKKSEAEILATVFKLPLATLEKRFRTWAMSLTLNRE